MPFREAKPDDDDRVLQVHRLAFGREEEATLVGNLMRDESARPLVSVVAEEQGEVVGHALFTTLHLIGHESDVECMILAPLAVVPTHQNLGIGRQLIEHGCETLMRRGTGLVFVLGDPNYYTRCGFGPAIPHGLHAPYTISPEEAWMVRPLEQHLLGAVKGTVVCARSLQPESYWRE
jgi:predicted N-acetyltransferase YhbS